jgi:hypothetical protein
MSLGDEKGELLHAWASEGGTNCYPLTEQTTEHRSCDEIDLINAQRGGGGGSQRYFEVAQPIGPTLANSVQGL